MIEVFAVLFLAAGLLFFLGASLGVLRFPDFYTRVHAAAKGDTLSTALFLMGFALYNLSDFSWSALHISIKIMFVTVFVSITSPTSSHALIDAGYETGLEPWTNGDSEEGS